jgi:cytochrome c-type biogenesis protein
MALLILSFIAGVLTVAAPCVLPLLPVIIGGSLVESSQDKPENRWLRPLVIACSLAVSVIIFSLLIKATTVFLSVPQIVWQILSGLIVIALGIQYLFPGLWERFSAKSGLFTSSNKILGKAAHRNGLVGAVLIGFALGPVFSSCSPTYALIVATILPASFIQGLVYLISYAVGMSATLLLVAYAGQVFIAKLQWLANPNGWFKKLIGALFILVGIMVLFGIDKNIQAYVLEQGWYDPIKNIEQKL